LEKVQAALEKERTKKCKKRNRAWKEDKKKCRTREGEVKEKNEEGRLHHLEYDNMIG